MPDDIALVTEHPSLARLNEFACGRLGEDDSLAIEAHLEGCDTCCFSLETSVAAGDDALLTAARSAAIREDRPQSVLRLHAGYRIESELGRGGMSVVYRARQIGLDRTIALKQIRAGAAAGAEELLRFRREAEAVAGLSHPGIVQVFDFGEQDGQPYLAMELMEGGTLAERLQVSPLSPRESALLLAWLAEAIDFAHRRGVVHRDIKPANVLFANAHDASPKLADFGLAKRAGDVAHTQTGVFAGTPSYMAPEQAADVGAAGAAADIYALGAVLYECLTGRPPFRGATILETLDQVREHEPAPPSQLQRTCPRDLETICLKCLQKPPEKRYASAAALAEDLRRFLDGRPIFARRASAAEKLYRWSKRRPAIAALVAVSTLAIAALAGGGWVATAMLQKSLAEKTAAKERAERNLAHARDAWNGNLWNVSVDALADVPDSAELRAKLLEQAVEQYEELFADASATDDATRIAYCMLLMTLADVRSELGEFAFAEKLYQRSIELADDLLRRDRVRFEYRATAAKAREHLAFFLHSRLRWAESVAPLETAIELLQKNVEAAPIDRERATEQQAALANVYDALARTQGALGDLAAAEAWREKSLALATQVDTEATTGGEQAINETSLRVIAGIYHNAALSNGGERQRELLDRAIAALERLVARKPSSVVDRAALANALIGRGYSLGEQEIDSAAVSFDRAREHYDELSRRFPRDVRWIDGAAHGDYMFADMLRRAGRNAEAKTRLEAALAKRQLARQIAPNDDKAALGLAETLNHLALVRAILGELPAAENDYLQAVAVQQELVARHPDDLRFALSLVATQINLSGCCRALGNRHDAFRYADEAVRACTPWLERSPQDAEVRAQLLAAHGVRALALGALSKPREAIADWDRVVDLAPPEQQLAHRLARALTLAQAGQHDRASREADLLAKEPQLAAGDRYNLACIHSLCGKAALADAESPSPREELANAYFAKALALLAEIKQVGFFDDVQSAAHAKQDADLAPLHERPEFAALFAE